MLGFQKLSLTQSILLTWRDNPREFCYQLALLAVAAIVLAGICGL